MKEQQVGVFFGWLERKRQPFSGFVVFAYVEGPRMLSDPISFEDKFVEAPPFKKATLASHATGSIL
jgi:hypothetical protein